MNKLELDSKRNKTLFYLFVAETAVVTGVFVSNPDLLKGVALVLASGSVFVSALRFDQVKKSLNQVKFTQKIDELRQQGTIQDKFNKFCN